MNPIASEPLVKQPDRSAQSFPRLNASQLATVKRFAAGLRTAFEPGAFLYEHGKPDVPAWFLVEGTAEMAGRDGFDVGLAARTLEAGQFTGELHQLSGRATLTSARAGAAGCTALPLDAARLRSLMVGSAEVGELIMRAFILRRVGLLEAGSGPILVGRAGSASLLRLQGFLTRSAYPHVAIDCASERGRHIIAELGLPPEDLPLLLCPCGRVLRHPTNREAGAWLGITPTLKDDPPYDVAVVGSGPAGLATAVYAASEGLSVIVIDKEVVGGQAGASARIENYLGFPTGISGSALVGRALSQAQKFGAQVAIPMAAERLDLGEEKRGDFELTLNERDRIRARTVVVASGARYRRPDVARLSDFEGAGVHYWASPVEAKLCANEEVALVGAGNSAGQAVVFLAPQVRRVHLIVRGVGLEASMSRYLVDRIAALDNVEISTRTELAELHGDPTRGLEGATFRACGTGSVRTLPIRHLFMFIGAEPNTEWLNGRLALDGKGYVLTGSGTAGAACPPLETSTPRVFAIGDVRSGSTKRVASAVGEGAAVVAQIHAVLGARSTTA